MSDTRTPFEREIDEASAFNPVDLFVGLTYRQMDRVCGCGAKHFELGPDCANCRGVQ